MSPSITKPKLENISFVRVIIKKYHNAGMITQCLHLGYPDI